MVAEERDAANLGLVGVLPRGLAEGGELDGLGPDGQLDLRVGRQVLTRDGDRLAAGVQDELGGAVRESSSTTNSACFSSNRSASTTSKRESDCAVTARRIPSSNSRRKHSRSSKR